MTDLDQFVRGYVECALWSSSIEEDFARFWAEKTGEDEPAADCSMQSFGFTADDIDPKSMEAIRAECSDFLEHNSADLDAYCERMGTWSGSDTVRGSNARYSAMEQAGGDFWLTRNGHGAGFWDRGLPDDLGQRLTEASKAYGEAYLYVADDETIYLAGAES